MPKHQRVVLNAHAKINLCLDLTGAAPNGYHLIDTIMHSVSLCDVVTLELTGSRNIEIFCSNNSAPADKSNIAYKAASAFFAVTGISPAGLSINLEKNIPAQAGLGGGSADGAAVLCGLNKLLAAGLDNKALCKIGLTIGSDLPFCIVGGCARAEGIGELMTPLPVLPDCKIVIVKPDTGVSTALAYKSYDEYTGDIPPVDVIGMKYALECGELAGVAARMQNVFETVAVCETAAIKKQLYSHGAMGAVLSGSGSAVAGIFAPNADVTACVKSFGCFACETRPMGSNGFA